MFTSHFWTEYLAGWKFILCLRWTLWCRFSLWYKLNRILIRTRIQRLWSNEPKLKMFHIFFVQQKSTPKYYFFSGNFYDDMGPWGLLSLFILLIHFRTLKTTFNDTEYFMLWKNGIFHKQSKNCTHRPPAWYYCALHILQCTFGCTGSHRVSHVYKDEGEIWYRQTNTNFHILWNEMEYLQRHCNRAQVYRVIFMMLFLIATECTSEIYAMVERHNEHLVI